MPTPEQFTGLELPDLQNRLQGIQNPQITDLLSPDPEAEAREKLLWNKINRGPRQRAKELEAEMWKDRYGITEKSGKFRRILGGLGETLRAIGAGKDYQSLQDVAAERGLKEYQTEVGPLQRELGVLSQARNAALNTQSRILSQNADRELKSIIAMSKMGVDSVNIAKALGKTEPEIQKMLESKAKTGDLEALEVLHRQQAANAKETKGQTGLFGAVNAQMQRPPEDQNKFLNALDKITRLQGLNKNTGAGGSTLQYMPSYSTREQFVDGPNGKERVVVNSTTNSPRRVPNAADPNYAAQQRAAILGGEPPPAVPTGQQPPLAQALGTTVGPVEARQLPPRSTTPKEFQYFDGKKYSPINIHPSQEGVLRRYKGTEQLPEWLAARFKHEVLPGSTRRTADDNVRAQFDDAANELLRSASQSYAEGKLDSLTGPWQNVVTKIKAMQSGGITLGDVKTRSDAVNAMALKILDLSGKAVTENERKILSTPLPDLSMDSDTTLLYKSVLLNQISRRMSYMKAMKLSDAEMSALKNVAEPELNKNVQRQLSILNSLNQAAKMGNTDPKGKVKIGNVEMTRQEARDLMLQLSQKDYNILTKSLQFLGQ